MRSILPLTLIAAVAAAGWAYFEAPVELEGTDLTKLNETADNLVAESGVPTLDQSLGQFDPRNIAVQATGLTLLDADVQSYLTGIDNFQAQLEHAVPPADWSPTQKAEFFALKSKITIEMQTLEDELKLELTTVRGAEGSYTAGHPLTRDAFLALQNKVVQLEGLGGHYASEVRGFR